ncbi:uncharacterized protein LOC127440041 [Myxocyprinus asiaticus]|uniref:uncharacterized protein LOC127440041 n=1 Tax=Myxocyprinus asiaticus TaxID=70543 RepID=UPI0022222BA7|nr:uncharacterized protein LOC127440041 [Myxocyprinus asiaticus]
MDATEKLIQIVYTYPVLYNVSCHNYRSSEKRAKAWRDVAASVGLSVVECKRRWRSIRDRYIRERRLCKLKREEGGRRLHHWPHRETLSFLDAHIRKRKRHSESEALEDMGGSGQESPEESLDESSTGDSKPTESRLEKSKSDGSKCDKTQTADSKEFLLNIPESKSLMSPQIKANIAAQLNPLSQLPLSIVTQLAPVKQVQPMTQLAVVTSLPPGLKVSQASCSTSPQVPIQTNATAASVSSTNVNGKMEEKEVLKSRDKPVIDRALDEDELFLLSYVPALKRLTPQKRAAVKMTIQQIMFDAEFKDD